MVVQTWQVCCPMSRVSFSFPGSQPAVEVVRGARDKAGLATARNGVDATTSLTRPSLPTRNALTTWVRRSPGILLPIVSLVIDADAIAPLRASSRAVELVKPSIVSSRS
jgi:hypothetical protein